MRALLKGKKFRENLLLFLAYMFAFMFFYNKYSNDIFFYFSQKETTAKILNISDEVVKLKYFNI